MTFTLNFEASGIADLHTEPGTARGITSRVFFLFRFKASEASMGPGRCRHQGGLRNRCNDQASLKPLYRDPPLLQVSITHHNTGPVMRPHNALKRSSKTQLVPEPLPAPLSSIAPGSSFIRLVSAPSRLIQGL